MRASAHAAKSVMNGTTGFRYRLAGAVFEMKTRKGTGKARRKIARLGSDASIPRTPKTASNAIGQVTVSSHSIST